jgi:hypothetical protein
VDKHFKPHNPATCNGCRTKGIYFLRQAFKQTSGDSMKDQIHHPDCPAIDGFGCHCAEIANSSNPYTERGLEDRTKPIRELPTFDGWTDKQIANYIESN